MPRTSSGLPPRTSPASGSAVGVRLGLASSERTIGGDEIQRDALGGSAVTAATPAMAATETAAAKIGATIAPLRIFNG
jgi:hypothetical protein